MQRMSSDIYKQYSEFAPADTAGHDDSEAYTQPRMPRRPPMHPRDVGLRLAAPTLFMYLHKTLWWEAFSM